MNNTELQHRLTEKISTLSPENLNLVWQIVENLTQDKPPINDKEYSIENLLQKWQYLINNNQELDPNHPLKNNDIQQICQFLSQSQQSRPVGLACHEFIVPDDFNDPLPDEITDLFYSQ